MAAAVATTANGTATAPSDYTAIPTTTVTFAPNETIKAVNVSVKGDIASEANETFFVNLSNATNAGQFRNTGMVLGLRGTIALKSCYALAAMTWHWREDFLMATTRRTKSTGKKNSQVSNQKKTAKRAKASRKKAPPMRGEKSNAKGLADLFLHGIQDIYYAENKLTKALPKIQSRSGVRSLRSTSPSRLPSRQQKPIASSEPPNKRKT